MKIGYACLTVGVPDTGYKTCIKKNATPEKLTELIAWNLSVLDRMLDYNIKHHIPMFRVSSDIIPFGSSPVNTLSWDQLFYQPLKALGQKARQNHIRLSMHPGQYTVLNSPNQEVVERAVEDLMYHARFLDALEMGADCKLILHIGGVYGDKPEAIKRFCRSYHRLDDSIKRRLVIENDDKLYTIQDVLAIGTAEKIPVVFDNLHNKINPSKPDRPAAEWLDLCRSTWHSTDGVQKMHYSLQAPGKKPGSHSETIYIEEFLKFYHGLERSDLDIMLEVKDKNLSAVKCINCVDSHGKIKNLEAEWARYKYLVLEHAPDTYQEIRLLLKDKQQYPAAAFYTLLEHALSQPITPGHAVNAAQHIWGYFKDKASDKEQEQFLKHTDGLKNSSVPISRVKRQLFHLAQKYEQHYLLDSYYFTL